MLGQVKVGYVAYVDGIIFMITLPQFHVNHAFITEVRTDCLWLRN